MIPDIREINLPKYATLASATCTLPDMGERSITTTVKIDSEVIPDFSYDWEIEFKGDKYIMPLRKPQGKKDNESVLASIDLTFQHWAMYQLKRWYFFETTSVESGTAIPDKYQASVSLNLADMCDLFNRVLDYYFGDEITLDLNPEWEYKPEPTTVEISHSYIWDVLIKFYELYGVRWQIENGGNRNLLRNAERFTSLQGWNPNSTNASLSIVNIDGINCIHAHGSIVNTNHVELEWDSDYTIHCEIKLPFDYNVTSSTKILQHIQVRGYYDDGSLISNVYGIGTQTAEPTIIKAGEWAHIIYHLHTRKNNEGLFNKPKLVYFIWGDPITDCDYYLKRVKVERGTIATAWSSAPEDTGLVPTNSANRYIIKVGYPTDEVSHIFEYGFNGGLMSIERQVQNENIRNIILGRGGEKNIPYRYFKDTDADNPTFIADPDWIPELKDIYFSELHGATFRSYIQGWNHRHYQRTSIISADMAYAPWAWMRGFTDEKFNPIEFVADEYNIDNDGFAVVADSSIAKYGELMGGLDNNEDIYPTIQGVLSGNHLNFFGEDFGRVDETIWVEQMTSDHPREESKNDSQTVTVVSGLYKSATIAANSRKEITLTYGGTFHIPPGKTGNLLVENLQIAATNGVTVIAETETVIISGYGKEITASGIPSGTWQFKINITLHNTSDKSTYATATYPEIRLQTATPSENLDTFDILIKNIWGTHKLDDETDAQYAERVWLPILGGSDGSEAKVIFSSGWLSTSEDYEFTIIGTPRYEETQCAVGDKTYTSHWRLKLARSTADYDTIGKMVPGVSRQGNAGDYFFFTGIELPYAYWIWAEEELDDYKKDILAEKSEIKPTFVVKLDPVRINNLDKDEKQTIISQIVPGASVTIQDKRFIDGSQQENLYLQSVTFTYNEPTDKDANLLPDVEIILGDDYATSANPVETLSGEVNELRKQVGSLSNVSKAIRATGDKIYLRKDKSDRTPYGLTVGGLLQLEQGIYVGDFISGMSGADVDIRGNAEFESVVVRSFMQIYELIVNRQRTIEGDVLLTEGDTIEAVTDLGGGEYLLMLHEEWDGYATAQYENNVLRGIYNNIFDFAPSGAGTTTINNATYYTSWMRVQEVGVDGNPNAIRVLMYPDTEVPAGRNFPPCPMMKFARWGNAGTDEECRRRQTVLYLSSTEGRIMKRFHVTKPIVDLGNVAFCLGVLPESLSQYDDRLSPGDEGIYVKNIVAENIIRQDHHGYPEPEIVNRGEWSEITAASTWVDDNSNIYSDGYFDGTVMRESTHMYERSVVSWYGCLWACAKNGTKTAPSWDNPDWVLHMGDPRLHLEWVGSEDSVYIDNPQITLSVAASINFQDVTESPRIKWDWQRVSDIQGVVDTNSDAIWNSEHEDIKNGYSISLTKDDMNYSFGNPPDMLQYTVCATLLDENGQPAISPQTGEPITRTMTFTI